MALEISDLYGAQRGHEGVTTASVASLARRVLHVIPISGLPTNVMYETPPNSPQRHQDRTRRALRELAIESEGSPRRRTPVPRPCSPTPQPGNAERKRAAVRQRSRIARTNELQQTPKRRRTLAQDENKPPEASRSQSGSQTELEPAFCSVPGHIISGLRKGRPSSALHAIANYRTAQILASPLPVPNSSQCSLSSATEKVDETIAATLADSTNLEQRALAASGQMPNARSIAQQRRRAREREERAARQKEQVSAPIHCPNTKSLAQRQRRAREREAHKHLQPQQDNDAVIEKAVALEGPQPEDDDQKQTNEQLHSAMPQAQIPNARSIAQQRRRAREREERAAREKDQALAGLPRTPARALAQQRRRARECETRKRKQAAKVKDSPHEKKDTVVEKADISRGSQVKGPEKDHQSDVDASLSETASTEGQPSEFANHLRRHRVRRRDLFCLARKPYSEPEQRHYLGRMDVKCPECGALHWLSEKLSTSSQSKPRFGMCCLEGRVCLPAYEDPPEPLQTLLSENDSTSKMFRDDIWKYNRAFAFTSLGVTEDHSVNEGRGQPVFRICGELCHRIGSLVPPSKDLPRYAQLYVYEPQAALEARMEQNKGLSRSVMQGLQDMLLEHHQYAPVFKHAYEILRDYDGPIEDAEVRLHVAPGLDQRRYNLPTVDEVAVILPGGQPRAPRDIILRNRSGPLHQISDLHPAYAPLQYPLLFPRGENGWHPDMILHESVHQREVRLRQQQLRQQKRAERGLTSESRGANDRHLTLCRYVAFRVHHRPNEFNILLRGGRLFTRYMVDMFASLDQSRLRYLADHQSQIHAAHFSGLEDAVMEDDDNLDLHELGQCVILPSSYIGGPRNMTQRFQDAMAIARFYRKVDIFLTMTTNPHWKEIEDELLPGQTAYDRPDLVTRVFNMKKDALIDYIFKHGIFGKAVAYVYTIEFQKRGLPHCHLLIFLKEPHKLLTTDAIDSCIWARWPDPETQPLLFETVKNRMVHGPCGALDPTAPCMVNGKCSKGYPKDFQPFTSMDRNGYPLYFRPDDGRKYQVGKHLVDNRWIVPYSPFLCAEFDCHINVECAISIGSIKYPFKYVYKGPDRAVLEYQRDEIKRWIDGRYISPPEASWRIFQFETHDQVPSVVRLQVHLEGHHMVSFNPNNTIEEVLRQGAQERTTLTAFFEANADSGQVGREARKHTYQEFPQYFTWDTVAKQWKLRKRKGFSLGRMYFIKPTAGEQYYLRMLLTVVKGPKSFEDLRRVPDQPDPLPTYHAACVARGLLEDDGEWRLCLDEAAQIKTGVQLRNLFATILLFSDVSQPELLWNDFRHHICDDLERRLVAAGLDNPTSDDIYDFGLYLLDQVLRESGHSLEDWPSMPLPQNDWDDLIENPLIAEQLNYDRNALRADLESRLLRLNEEQRHAYNEVIQAVYNDCGSVFFLNGPGGTGKTFVYNTVCAKLRSEGFIVLCASSSGISALLLQGGRTAHSMFKIPVETLHEDSICSISKESRRADLLRHTSLIIWDEVVAQHRHAVEALDRTLRDICNVDQPFGGITTVLGGDFLQTLPVVPHGSRADIVDATIQHSHLWEHVKVLFLRQNMRLEQADDDTQQFAQWLIDVGHGRNHINGNMVRFPDYMRADSVDNLIEAVYPGISSPSVPPREYFLSRMILAPRNIDVGDINQEILDRMSGESRQYISADAMIQELGADPCDEEPIPVEYLRSINSPSLPPGELNLKVGCPVILLRNLAPYQGLCNGTRMVVSQLGNRVIEVILIGGERDGQKALIPRISLTPTTSREVSFNFKRRQFPIRLAFAMSINKAQGQSVQHVGLYMHTPVFAHGQLYVAFSRATSPRNIKVLLPEDAIECMTPNVVYEEVLLD